MCGIDQTCANQGCVPDLVDGAERGGQNAGLITAIIIDRAHVGDQVHAINVDTIKTPYERQ